MEIKELNGVLYYSGVGLPDNNVRPEVESVFFYINEETQKKYVWTINRISGVGNWIELGDTLKFIIFDELPEPSEEYSTTIALILNPTSPESEDEYDEYACIYNNELSAWEWEKLNSYVRFWSNYYYDADGNLILSKQDGGEITSLTIGDPNESGVNVNIVGDTLTFNGSKIMLWEKTENGGYVLDKDVTNVSADGSLGVAHGNSTHANGNSSHAEGTSTTTIGVGSHTEGFETRTEGDWSHAEGRLTQTIAGAQHSHAEGNVSIARGAFSHAEGTSTNANGEGAHAEGLGTFATGNWSHAEGNGTNANGTHSHAEGNGTTASGAFSHAEGTSTSATVEGAHAEGQNTIASGIWSHTEGQSTTASGIFSHAEGQNTTAIGSWSHAEGNQTRAEGNWSHTEGQSTTASGALSHAEGKESRALAEAAHAEGSGTYAYAPYSHAEGQDSQAHGSNSHAEGGSTAARGTSSHAEGGNTNAVGDFSHTEGYSTSASGMDAHAEGNLTTATSNHAHAEGFHSSASNIGAHAEGNDTSARGQYSHTEGYNTTASADYSHAEGQNTTASNVPSHAEGANTTASGPCSHAEGNSSIAAGNDSHAEGHNTRVGGYEHGAGGPTPGTYSADSIGEYAHAEGNATIAKGNDSHAEGKQTLADGYAAHAEGNATVTRATAAHAEGNATTALGNASHTEGVGTKAQNISEHAEGSYNNTHRASDTYGNGGNTQHSIGIGTEGDGNGKNAVEVMQNGDFYMIGVGNYQGTNIKVQDPSILTVQEVINGSQHALTAGDNIDITNNVISVVGIIDDSDVSTTSTYSSTKIESIVDEINQRITDDEEVVSAALNDLKIDIDRIELECEGAIKSITVNGTRVEADSDHNVELTAGTLTLTDADNRTLGWFTANSTALIQIPGATSSEYGFVKVDNTLDSTSTNPVENRVITSAISSLVGIRCEVVSELPATGENGVIYFVPNDGSEPNIYDEYIWIDSTSRFELIGTTEIDLSNYVTKNDLNSTLLNYVSETELTNILNNYVTDSEFDNLIEDVNIQLSDIDRELSTKQDKLTEGYGIDIIGNTISVESDFVTKSELDERLSYYLTDSDGYAISNEINELYETKQDKLIEGYGIDITGNVISVESDFVTESELDERLSYYLNDSDGYVISSAINELYDTKQDKLTAGNNMTISNDGVISADVPTVGAGNLNIKINQSGTVSPVSDFNANQDSDEDIIFSAGSNVTLSASGNTITISATGGGGEVGTLNTTNTTSLTPQSGESLSGTIDLHKISKTGSYSDLIGAPTLATVATSGSYNDLSNKPTIPAAQVNADWNASSGVSEILNKPTFATVATSGSYNDLSDKPTIPAAQVNVDWNASSGVSEILNKPTFATVATSGSYNDLSNKPNIPTVGDGSLHIKVDQYGSDIDVIDFNANQDSSDDITFVAGSNITLTPDVTNKTITISATGGGTSGIDITVPSDNATYPILLGNTDDGESDVTSIQKSVGLVVNPNKKSVAEGDQTVAYGENSHVEGTYDMDSIGGQWDYNDNSTVIRSYGGSGSISDISVNQIVIVKDGDENVYRKVVSVGETSFTVDEAIVHGETETFIGEVIGGIAYGKDSHAEGMSSAIGEKSHAEGHYSSATGKYSHAEGDSTTAYGENSHAEGDETTASGNSSHAEGYFTTASGGNSHAEGADTTAFEFASHAEGSSTTASGTSSHAEGQGFLLQLSNILSITSTTIKFSELPSDIKIGSIIKDAYDAYAKVTNINTSTKVVTVDPEISSSPNYYLVYGIANGESSHAEGGGTTASGYYSHAEGANTIASGECSHAEGGGTTASEECSHAEGNETTASGYASHAEGYYTIASGAYSHAEGENARAFGEGSHAEGNTTTALGNASHVEGQGSSSQLSNISERTATTITFSTLSGDIKIINTSTKVVTVDSNLSTTVNLYLVYGIAYGNSSHAEGWHTTASGNYSHASGQYTIANRDSQTVVGKYNDESLTDALFVVGNGTDAESKSNAFYVKTDGNVYASGAYYAASDKRKKDIIGDIDLEKAYSLLENCQTVTYTWKDDESKKQQIGVIAQEIQQFFPEIVNEDEHGMLSVDYSRLTVILMSVIKNNIKEMKSLEERIKLLEEKK